MRGEVLKDLSMTCISFGHSVLQGSDGHVLSIFCNPIEVVSECAYIFRLVFFWCNNAEPIFRSQNAQKSSLTKGKLRGTVSTLPHLTLLFSAVSLLQGGGTLFCEIPEAF